ncbi:MAG: hypothetical protein KGN33_08100 [Paracoccaceae bacterium]|nr:hypothetical protein [Paracoccaceae bacterium]
MLITIRSVRAASVMLGFCCLSLAVPSEATPKVGWVGHDRYLSDTLFSNVTRSDMAKLLAGNTFVGIWQDGKSTPFLRIIYFGNQPTADKNGVPYSGTAYGCEASLNSSPSNPKYWPTWDAEWKPFTVWGKYKAPQIKFENSKRQGFSAVGYALVRYDGHSGGLTFYYGDHSIGQMVRGETGRLQKEIPGVVYRLCHDFPSAKSLGAKVDWDQNSYIYNKILKQGGTPVVRPDLVTAHPERLAKY